MPPRKRPVAAAARPELMALLEACKDAPDDDAPRLVLADWLEEHGDEADRARAELIRGQLRRAREDSGAPIDRLTRQADALRERYQAEWLGPLWEWGGKGEYALHAAWGLPRGLAVLAIEASRFVTAEARRRAVGEAWAWVAGVELKHGLFEGDKGRKLIDCPLLAGLTSPKTVVDAPGRGEPGPAARLAEPCPTRRTATVQHAAERHVGRGRGSPPGPARPGPA